MAVPTHGYDCRSETYPTVCNYCGQDVFYMECNHGSKVFFDELGDPWPIHFCAEYALAQQQANYAAAARTALRTPSRQGIRVRRVMPFDGQPIVVGQVLEINEVNFLRRLGYVNTAMARALLGRLGDRRYVEVTVREGPVGIVRAC